MLGGARQEVKKPFKSKKCIFWPKNDIFSRKPFYSKFISGQNYTICTCQKIHFQNKIMRLQFSPDSTYTCHIRLWFLNLHIPILQICLLFQLFLQFSPRFLKVPSGNKAIIPKRRWVYPGYWWWPLSRSVASQPASTCWTASGWAPAAPAATARCTVASAAPSSASSSVSPASRPATTRSTSSRCVSGC